MYLPPYNSLRQREIDEHQAREEVNKVITSAPVADVTIAVGDFNARCGTRAPRVHDTVIPRRSIDTYECYRAPWFIRLCEEAELHILNGNEYQEAPGNTCFHHGTSSTTVDYILSSNGTTKLYYDATTLQNLTDHSILHVTIPVTVTAPSAPGAPAPAGPVTYKWDVGTATQQQQAGIARWVEHTGQEGFRRGMAAIAECRTMTNEERSTEMERFLLREGQVAGVVSETTVRTPTNPNRWGKHLAPWFEAECHAAKKKYKTTCKTRGKGDEQAKIELKEYQKTCKQAKKKYTEGLPDMLKYRPVEFWRMFQRGKQTATSLDLHKFADFNTQLFADASAEPDQFKSPQNVKAAAIGPEELRNVLEKHFKANRSSGLSAMPLQLLKHLSGSCMEEMASFLNNSAIEQLAPRSWRCTKVVPLYKGSGDENDMNNYRSIAITPPFTKLFMSVMNRRLTEYAEAKDLHAPTQAGFRAKHATTEQALIV